MPTSIWSGAISFGLVSIPVRLYPATESKSVRFNMLHREDGARVREKYFCAACNQELEQYQTVKGYHVGAGHYIALTDADLDAIPVRSLHTVDIASFVDLASIDPILFEHTYFLAPEEIGVKPFALLRRVLQDTGKVAVGRFTLRHKEKAAVLRCYRNTIALSVLYAPDEVRDADDLRDSRGAELGPASVDAASTLIAALASDFRPESYRDEYRHTLLAIIQEKAAALERPELPPHRDAMPDLMAALQAAVEEARRKKEEEPKKRRKLVAAPA